MAESKFSVEEALERAGALKTSRNLKKDLQEFIEFLEEALPGAENKELAEELKTGKENILSRLRGLACGDKEMNDALDDMADALSEAIEDEAESRLAKECSDAVEDFSVGLRKILEHTPDLLLRARLETFLRECALPAETNVTKPNPVNAAAIALLIR